MRLDNALSTNSLASSQPIGFSLVVLAAGLGSRFGGNKPLAGFGPNNTTLLELNMFNAYQAGCRHVVLIIAPNSQPIFEQQFSQKFAADLVIEYAFQAFNNLPHHCSLSISRHKPLGTAHALWCCRHLIKGPFVVTNGDDYYGANALQTAQHHFNNNNERWGIVAYNVANTLSNFGGVNRGLCSVNSEQQLTSINECYDISLVDEQIQGQLSEQLNNPLVVLAASQLVSMNFWLLTPAIFDVLADFIQTFLSTVTSSNECQLPDVIEQSLTQRAINVYSSESQWFGLTYPQDKEWVKNQLNHLKNQEKSFYLHNMS